MTGETGFVRLGLAGALAPALGVGCATQPDPAEAGPPAATCAWLADHNCWEQTLAEATPCLPEAGAQGVLKEGMGGCSFDDGTEVRFASAAADPIAWFLQPEKVLSIERGGETCLTFTEVDDGDEFRVGFEVGGEAVELDLGPPTLLTCPSGEVWELPPETWSCPELAEHGPGYTLVASESTISVSLVGLGGEVRLFDCRLPAGEGGLDSGAGF